MNTTQKIEEGSQQLSDDFSTSLLRNDTLEIGNIALPLKSREVYVSCYPDNYVMRYSHQSVGVISQSFLNL